jgi:hypothetical protein
VGPAGEILCDCNEAIVKSRSSDDVDIALGDENWAVVSFNVT